VLRVGGLASIVLVPRVHFGTWWLAVCDVEAESVVGCPVNVFV
jgi:hypothetical protein